MTHLLEGERAKFNRRIRGMWDSSNNGLSHGTLGTVSEVRLKDGQPFWYEFTTDGGTSFRVDIKQLTKPKQAPPTKRK